MKRVFLTIISLLLALTHVDAQTDRTYNQIDESGNISQRSEGQSNRHNNDSTRNKVIPKGIYVWTIDRRLGDITPAEPDTISHLFPNTTFNTGKYGEYNTTGNNYTARLSRIFINRDEFNDFIFTQPYSLVAKEPDKWLWLNTLSPYTKITFDECGDMQHGEDHIDAIFGVNVNKRLHVGFDLDYAYARGYFSNQSTSHFSGSLFSSYRGDKYQMHFFFNAAHQKASENGGITNDLYITHPESFQESLNDNEIPTVLSQNWNRNDHQHIFLTHRYNIGFYRMVKLTEAELKAREFAKASKEENAKKKGEDKDKDSKGRNPKKEIKAPAGRPKDAVVVGKEPTADGPAVVDSTRIKINNQAMIDSLNRAQAIQDSIDATMKREYVPVTSFIHTFEFNNNQRIYQAYKTPTDYYLKRYYDKGTKYGNDSIYDETKFRQFKNTFGIALLEGFNKYMKAGLKGFITYDMRNYNMPDTVNNVATMSKWSENDLSIGAQLSKTQGKTLHFNAELEANITGPRSGDLRLDFTTDLNFPLFGDTVQLAAKAYLHRFTNSFYLSKYHSKHFWWDNNDLSKETRTRIEGIFSYTKTNTKLRVAMDNIKDYTYFGMNYDATTDGRTKLTAAVYQESSNINVLTAQLFQNFRLGPLHWENVVTYQNSSNKEVLPLPTLNIFTNLYLGFKIAKVLGVELGADMTYFTKYYAPDFCPGINQFAIQKTEASKEELGGFPFIDVYANFCLKKVRFFLIMTNVVNKGANHMKFLAPHYPTNGSVIHFGISWPFFN